MSIRNVEGLPPTAAPAPAGPAVATGQAREQAPLKPVAPAATPTTQASAAPPPQEASPGEVAQAIKESNRAMTALSTAVQFFLDPDSKTMVVRIVDTATDEVLRQVPAQEMMDIARALDRVKGLLLHTKV